MSNITKAKQILFNNAVANIPNNPTNVQVAFEELKTVVDSKVAAIAAGSTNYLEIVNGNELAIKALAITDVVVDAVESSIGDYVTSNYTGTELQEGDVVVLTTPGETYIHNGGSAGTTADFTRIAVPNVTDAYIRGLFSAGNGITYTAATGVIAVNLAANSGLAFNAGALEVDVDDVTIERPAGVLKVKADGIGITEINNAVGQVDAEFIKIDALVAGVASGGSIQDALEALDAKAALGTRTAGTVACPVQVANTNFNVTVPATALATQPRAFYINGQYTIPVTVSGTTITFNVSYAVDATDEVEYEFFA